MATTLNIAGWLLLSVWLLHYTWVLFAAIMNARRVRDLGKLTPQARTMTVIALVIGYPLDALANLVFSALLADWPQEVLLSGKLWRLSQSGGGWRKAAATWLRERFLDWFDDRGVHTG